MPYKSKVERKLYMKEYRARKKLQGNSDLQSFLDSISGCPNCLNIPSVFVTSEKIPLCQEHANALADTDIEW